MEPLAFTRRVIAWRWTPCVAPVTGSVLIALLTLAVVPDELGASSTGTGAPASASRDKRDNISDSAKDDAESRGPPPGATEAHSRGPRKSGRQRMAAEATRGLLDTEQELPIAPGGPPPEPEPAPPLRPSPEVFTPPDPALAAPPPVEEPGTLPPLNAPPPLGPHAPPPNAGMP